ncbi:MAG: CotH kinase family protein [Clostridia bacterium]|nr:CotH kinase family protein [Clostridia bacterium]
MRKSISLVLCIFVLVSVFAMPLGVSAAPIETPTDVPKVIITTRNTVNTDKYVGCSITIIDEEGGTHEVITDSDSSFKIRGNSTSSGEKKPFNIKFSGKTDVLGMGKAKKWCLLANCYEKTLIRNQMILDFARNLGLDYTPQYRVVDVYLNNRFLGSYLLTDPIEAGGTRIDIDTDGNEFVLERDARTDEETVYFETPIYNIRFGINEPEEQTAEQYSWLMDFITKAENALKKGSYSDVEKYFDIESMIDFYIVLELSKNVDINVGSTRFYIKDGLIHGGPCWDFDLSMGNCSSSYYTTYNNIYTTGLSYQGLWAETLWFKPLLKFSEFRNAVNERYLELQDDIVNLYADNVNGKNYIDATVEKYSGTISRNYKEAGWIIPKIYSTLERVPESTYEANIEYLRDWLYNRNKWLLKEWGLNSEITSNSNNYSSLNGYFIEANSDETTATQLLSDYSGLNSLYHGDKKLVGKTVVPHGSILTKGGASYMVVLKGDVVADGSTNARDYAIIKRTALKTATLNDVQIMAADINGNGAVDAQDYQIVKRHVLGSFDIYDN